MKLYMTNMTGVDASSSTVEVEVENMQPGDLVLGVIGISSPRFGSDLASSFASVVTTGTTPGITNALVQNNQNLSGVTMIVLLQRGTTAPVTGEVDINLQG